MNTNDVRPRSYTDQEFIKAVKTSRSIQETIRKIGIHVCGGNYQTIRRNALRLNLSLDHFSGQSWNKGNVAGLSNGLKRPMTEILVENSTYTNNFFLKQRLIKEGYFEHKCYRCNRTEWEGQKIPIQLEHKNGVHNDNRIKNITFLCPNCHALTDTYCGKNKKRTNSKLIKNRSEAYRKRLEKKKVTQKRYRELYKKEREEKEQFFRGLKKLNPIIIKKAMRKFKRSEITIRKLFKKYGNSSVAEIVKEQ